MNDFANYSYNLSDTVGTETVGVWNDVLQEFEIERTRIRAVLCAVLSRWLAPRRRF
jgi:hypothetical protein